MATNQRGEGKPGLTEKKRTLDRLTSAKNPFATRDPSKLEVEN